MYNYGNLISATIRGTIILILGEKITDTFYSYFLEDLTLRQNAIEQNPEAFSVALQKAFGKSAKNIERMIILNICNKIGTEFSEIHAETLTKLLENLKERYTSTNIVNSNWLTA